MDKPKPNPRDPKTKMDAYIIMLHLRSQGWTQTTEIWKLLGWDQYYSEIARARYAYINHMIMHLSEQWNEDIPRINAFIFKKEGKCTDYPRKDIFGKDNGEQPTPKEIAELATKIDAYPNWNKVVEVFRREAFEAV